MTRETNEAIAELRQLIEEACSVNDEAVLQDGYTIEQEAKLDGLLHSITHWAHVARIELRQLN